jgi:hypothetical protein
MMNDNERLIAGYMDANLGMALLFQFGRFQSKDQDYIDGWHDGRTSGMVTQYLPLGAITTEQFRALEIKECFR